MRPFGEIAEVQVQKTNWLEKAKAACKVNLRRDWNRWEETYVCCWCKLQYVQRIGETCSSCQKYPNMQFLDMTLRDERVTTYTSFSTYVAEYKGEPFYHYGEHDPNEQQIEPQVVLCYAHMRIERQQKEIDALKSEMHDLKSSFSEFMQLCEFAPDGETAKQAVERLNKCLKK